MRLVPKILRLASRIRAAEAEVEKLRGLLATRDDDILALVEKTADAIIDGVGDENINLRAENAHLRSEITLLRSCYDLPEVAPNYERAG